MIAAVLALLWGCAEEPATRGTVDTGGAPLPALDPLDWGHFEAGATSMEFVMADGTELIVEVWYPAAPHEGDEPAPYPEIPITKDAYRDAPPDLRGAPYPLVAFSHGLGGIRYQSAFLTEHLARHGYVVVAPDHPYSTLLDLDDDRSFEVAIARPGQITASVDEVLAQSAAGHPLLGDLVEDESFAMMGHSFGAFTTLLVGGGVFEPEAWEAYCSEHDARGCGYVGEVDASLIPETLADPRVVTTVPMSPGLWYAFGEDGAGLEALPAPLAMCGDKDTLLNWPDEQQPVYEALAAPKAAALLADAGHYAFSDICEVAPFFDDCGGPEEGWIPIEDAHAITKHTVTAWLDVHLAGQADQAVYLEETELSAFPELTWMEE